MNSKFYPKLFSPLKLPHKAGTLKNRLIMGSMHTGLEGHSLFPTIFERVLQSSQKLEPLAEFYAARARGGVGLIITGGFSPNVEGTLYPFGSKLDSRVEAERHRVVTDAVKEHSIGGGYLYPEDGPYAAFNSKIGFSESSDCVNGGGVDDCTTKICLQILHSGRYAAHPFGVSSTSKKSPISPFSPRKLNVEKTIDDFVKCAEFAKEAGYHGVEVMGSEGYLINQFITPRTASADKQMLEDRISFPMKIVRGIRDACGDDFIIVYRISLVDLVENGMPWEEVVELARRLENDGSVSILNAGIGWHESRVPTIATSVPRGAWNWAVTKLKESLPELSIPVSVVNRINTPDIAEKLLTGDSAADLVTLARPFLADELFPTKAFHGNSELINTCIGCNQACLDHVFKGKTASCLVNPYACKEKKFDLSSHSRIISSSSKKKQRIAVIGAGPAGLSFSLTAQQLGHDVTIFDKAEEIGGQFNLAKRIPGKQEFYETLRFFQEHLDLLNVKVHMGVTLSKANIENLLGQNQFDRIILATGVNPRIPDIEGVDHHSVISYYDLLTGNFTQDIGNNVAVLGAGGIGFDVSEYLLHRTDQNQEISKQDMIPDDFFKQWGVDVQRHRTTHAQPYESDSERRKIYLMQRKGGKLGAGLGKTTGWIHRSTLKQNKVNMLNSVSYEKIDDDGLHISIENNGEKENQTIKVDNIILCTGQESNHSLYHALTDLFPNKGLQDSEENKHVYKIGGAYLAGELDAKRAIDMGMRLAFRIHESKVNEDDLADTVDFSEKLVRMTQRL